MCPLADRWTLRESHPLASSGKPNEDTCASPHRRMTVLARPKKAPLTFRTERHRRHERSATWCPDRVRNAADQPRNPKEEP